MNRRGRGLGWTLGGLAVIAYALLPVAWMVSLSLKSGDDVQNRAFWPSLWTLQNYRAVFETPLFTAALRNSIGIALIATALSMVLATFAAVWVLHRTVGLGGFFR